MTFRKNQGNQNIAGVDYREIKFSGGTTRMIEEDDGFFWFIYDDARAVWLIGG